MSHASQQYAFTEPRTVKRAQVKPSEREHQTSSSAPRVSLAPAADRTLDILEFIASNGQTQAATLARELGIPRSTVYQLLEILERHGLVTRLAEQRAYGIGLKTFELGSAYSRQHRVSQVAHPVLARLVDETGENGHLAVLHGNEIIYVIEERAVAVRDYNDFPIAGLALTFVSGSLRPEQERSLKTKLRLAGTELSRRLGAVGSLT